jgi:hypothetical protein
MSIGYICRGDGAQLTCYEDFRDCIDEMIYVRDIREDSLAKHAAVVVPDWNNTIALQESAKVFNDYLRGGGFLIVFGPNRMHTWIDVVPIKWFNRPTENWKWFMVPNGRMEAYQPDPEHPLAKAIPLQDMCWHFFGAFEFMEGARPVLNLDNDEGCLMFDYELPGGGRLLATTIDPHTHHGRRFMPATTRFLTRFYPWLRETVAERIASR